MAETLAAPTPRMRRVLVLNTGGTDPPAAHAFPPSCSFALLYLRPAQAADCPRCPLVGQSENQRVVAPPRYDRDARYTGRLQMWAAGFPYRHLPLCPDDP